MTTGSARGLPSGLKVLDFGRGWLTGSEQNKALYLLHDLEALGPRYESNEMAFRGALDLSPLLLQLKICLTISPIR